MWHPCLVRKNHPTKQHDCLTPVGLCLCHAETCCSNQCTVSGIKFTILHLFIIKNNVQYKKCDIKCALKLHDKVQFANLKCNSSIPGDHVIVYSMIVMVLQCVSLNPSSYFSCIICSFYFINLFLSLAPKKSNILLLSVCVQMCVSPYQRGRCRETFLQPGQI